jgi:hypothetical protein
MHASWEDQDEGASVSAKGESQEEPLVWKTRTSRRGEIVEEKTNEKKGF